MNLSTGCSHRPPCPGCPRFGRSSPGPEKLETLRKFCAEIGATCPPLVEGAPLGYRHRARLAIRGRSTSPKIGIFQEDSHRIVDIPDCPVHHPLVNDVASAVKSALRATGLPPYADAPHKGLLRYLQAVVERRSNSAQVVLVTHSETPETLEPMVEPFATAMGDRLHSLWWNGNTERTNRILGSNWHRIHGPPATVEEVGDVEVFYPPGAFGQANLDLADALTLTARGAISPGARVVEYYAGCGAIGLGLLADSTVTFVENSPPSIEGLLAGINARPRLEREKAQVVSGDASQHSALVENADAVLLDPPRKGIDGPVLEALVATPPPEIVTIHCGFQSFLEDVGRLAASRNWGGIQVIPHALFPQTDHVEVLTVFKG